MSISVRTEDLPKFCKQQAKQNLTMFWMEIRRFDWVWAKYFWRNYLHYKKMYHASKEPTQ